MRWVTAIRLKENTKTANPLLEVTAIGKEVLRSHKDCLSAALKYLRKHSIDNKAAYLIHAAKICRDMMQKKQKPSGDFTKNCQTESTLQSFLSFLHTVSCSSYKADDYSIFPLKYLTRDSLLFFMHEKYMMFFKWNIGRHISLVWWAILSYINFLLLSSAICYNCWSVTICDCQRNPKDQIRWASWKNFSCVNRVFFCYILVHL